MNNKYNNTKSKEVKYNQMKQSIENVPQTDKEHETKIKKWLKENKQ